MLELLMKFKSEVMGGFRLGGAEYKLWERIKNAVLESTKRTDNRAKEEIHDCDVCENGTTRLDSFRPDIYRYCPWCSRELPETPERDK